MNMCGLDWTIVVLMVLLMIGGASVAGAYMRGVADFLAAGRTAGRYLLAVSAGMAGLGAISILRDFQMNYEAGFAMSWWGLSMSLVMVILAVTGWVNYRFRETRCFTLAEFFERRYSRRFRIFAGIVAFGSGLINFGIFPAVEARFFMHFMGLPESLHLPGRPIPTYPATMIFLLATALYFVFRGGQVAAMVTSFIQGVFANFTFLALAVFLLLVVSWSDVTDVLTQVPSGHSKINPFDTGYVETFNFTFFIIGVAGVVYNAMSWQGTQAYNSSARSAHEAKMGLVISTWRGSAQSLVITLLPILIFVVMHHPRWSELQATVATRLASIANPEEQSQMRVPVALAALLPSGLVGAFAALMLCAAVGTQAAYMHSWASIFVQDVVLPLRGRPLTPARHLLLLRLAVVGVAVHTFFFSLFYEQNQAIALFFALTGAIFVGWSGAVVIGGLYWKRGTTAGAWAAGMVGLTITLGGLVLSSANAGYRRSGRAFWGGLDWIGREPADRWGAWLNENLPNGQELWGLAMPCCLVAYALVSLIYRPRVFDLQGLLARGALAGEGGVRRNEAPSRGWRVLGMNEEFSRRDRALYILTYAWTFAWVAVFAVGTVYFLTRGVSGDGWRKYDAVWMEYWRVYLWISLGVSTIVVAWFTVGGTRDLAAMLSRLGSMARNERDDGVVRSAAAPPMRGKPCAEPGVTAGPESERP
jgi:SSS family solute:Na+ symporter